MAIYTQCPGWKKIEKLTIGGGGMGGEGIGYLGLETTFNSDILSFGM